MIHFKFVRRPLLVCCLLAVLIVPAGCVDRQLKESAARDPLACAMLVAQHVDSGRQRDQAIAYVAGRYSDLKQFAKAIEVTRPIQNPSIRVSSMANIAKKQWDAGDKEAAKKLMSEALRQTEDMSEQELWEGFVLASMAVNYAGMDDLDEALRVTKRIKDWQYPKEDVIKKISAKYAEAGNYKKGIQLAHSLPSAFYSANALVGIAGQYQRAGQKEKAAAELTEALSIALTDPVMPSKVNTMAAIAGSYGDFGQPKAGLAILSDAARAVAATTKDAADEQGEDQFIYAMANGYARCGQHDQALLWAGKIRDEIYRIDTISELAIPDQYDAVLQMIRTLSDPYVKARVLAELAVKYSEAGKKEIAPRLLDEALTVGRSDEGSHKHYSLEDIGRSFAKIGNIARSADVLADSLEAVKALKDDSQKSGTLADIAMICAETGQPINQRGLKILREIASQYW